MDREIKPSVTDKPRNHSLVDLFDPFLGLIREPLILLDVALRVVKANPSFYQTFKISSKKTEGIRIFDLDNHLWDIPQLRELLVKALDQNTEINPVEMEHTFGAAGRRIMQVYARRINDNEILPRLILLSIVDVTDRETHKRDLESLVKKRTADLEAARKEAEASLREITTLKNQLEAERAYLLDEIKLEYNHENIIGHSEGIRYVLYKIEQIASSDTHVLILGETGTGKELAARAIHSLSLRKNRALVKVNCATLPENLIESELFGHEKGAFTGSQTRRLGRFEIADGATLFLDEIGELPLPLQSKLLRVIQDGEFERLGSSQTIKVDVRIIAATNRNLEEEVRKGRFRDDLWYRINVFPITLPPLRDRTSDIPLLVDYYVKKLTKRLGKTIEFIPAGVMRALQAYPFPGNIRELENVLERAVINSSGPKLHLADDLNKPMKDVHAQRKTLEMVERDHILRVLEQTRWKVSGKNSASEILGLNRSTLRARMRKLHIEKPE